MDIDVISHLSDGRRFYTDNPYLRRYFLSLPPNVQNAVVQSGLCIGTLGELQLWAEHYMRRQ